MSTYRDPYGDLGEAWHDFPVDTPFFDMDLFCAALDAIPEAPEVFIMPERTYRHMIEIRDRHNLYMRVFLPGRPRKHWVMDQDWKQRLPRRRRRRR